MKILKENERRSGKDRREVTFKRIEEYIHYFISDKDERRSGVDRRKIV